MKCLSVLQVSQVGIPSFECPESDQARQRGAYVAQLEEGEAPPHEVENMPKTGEALVLNKYC